MKKTMLTMAAAMLMLASCDDKQNNTETQTTNTVEPMEIKNVEL
jgi:uncharacterized lipoprotein YajG